MKHLFPLVLILFLPTILPTQESHLEIYSETEEDGTITFFADNSHVIPLTATLTFETHRGFDISTENPYIFIIEPGTTKMEVSSLIQKKDARQLSYSLSYTYVLGIPDEVNPDEDYLYLLPFEHGKKHQLTQGFHGKFTHFADNEYAMDFEMDIGTPVVAARNGVVIEVKEDSNRGGPTAAYDKDANFVLIYHDDGTFGNYVHLKKNGALVDVGDEIEAGDIIGMSGNTGRSSGPHLHFDIRVPSLEGMQSIPVKLRGLDGEELDPQEGLFYYSAHPGKPVFDAVYGRDIANSDYVDFIAKVSNTESIEFRVEQIDYTFVIFIANGFKEKMEVTTTLQTVNMNSTTENPLEMVLQPLEEVFLTILRPQQGKTSFRYGYSYSYRPVE